MVCPDICGYDARSVPKRPPRAAAELPVPADLRAEHPVVAYRDARGELWRADALELLGTLADESVDLVVADPPYAIAKAKWDEFESMAAYLAWCDQWIAEVVRVLRPDGTAYICGFSEILAEIKVRAAPRFAACRWLIWYYRNKANLGQDWGRSHESILHLRRSRETRIFVDSVRIPYNAHTTRYPGRVQAVSSQYNRGRRDHWEPNPLGAKPRDVFEIPVLCNGMEEKTLHETQKPEALIEKLILASSAPGDLVLDPFVGSGTTAVVAARLHRRWLAGDADPRYVGLTRQRLAAAPVAEAAADAPLAEAEATADAPLAEAKATVAVRASGAKPRPSKKVRG
jgi:site-specific DNA-methyltransferase (adenine-specific)